MNKQSSLWLVVMVVVAAVSALLTRHFAAAELRHARIDEGLAPVVALLKDNQKILASLEAEGYPKNESALLERYLSDIRRDGVPKYAATGKRIATLVDNDTVIVALLANQSENLRSVDLKVQAEKYREFAAALRNRWQSTFETFMAGGSLPAAGPERPDGILAAVEGEIAAQ